MKNNLHYIEQWTRRVRHALECAKAAGLFKNNPWMEHFPNGSCLRATEILAEYLYRKRINTIIVQGSRPDGWTHAWLTVNDRGIQPEQHVTHIPIEVREALRNYGADFEISDTIINTQYKENIIRDMTVVDITIDQFGLQFTAPYIGPELDLHRQFEITTATDYKNTYENDLYNTVRKWLT